MMTCAACSTIPGPPVEISDACAQLPGKTPLPALKKGDNAKVALAETRAGMEKLNGRIGAKDQCYRNQRQRLSS